MIKRALVFLGLLLCSAPAFAQRDMVDISNAVVWNSPPDVAAWPITTRIDALSMSPSNAAEPGLAFTFPAHGTWPDYTPPGWDGPLQYTVWAGVKINGVWNISGIIQMWRERAATGAPILTDFARNWVYDARWGAMQGYQPVAGESMIFFLTAGNARGVGTVTSLRERSNVVAVKLPAGDSGTFTFSNSSSTMPPIRDFDGDGRADLAYYKAQSGTWGIALSSAGYTNSASGSGLQADDLPVLGDYDGDGKTDVAIYRPNTGTWWILKSSTGFSVYSSYAWGNSSDVPVPGDYDGDGKTDFAVYRPSTGQWWILWSSTNFTTYSNYGWGANGDVPVSGDFDGDGKTDIAVYRPATGRWWILKSSTGFTTYNSYGWGASGDVPLPGDYDGDGKSDIAVYRPATGQWWILKSSTGFSTYSAYAWGSASDVPVVADYDGDGKADIAVYRPSTGGWWILTSGSGYSNYLAYTFGQP